MKKSMVGEDILKNLLPFLFALMFITCQHTGESTVNDFQYSIKPDFSTAQTLVLSEWFDSIKFVALSTEAPLFGHDAYKLLIKGDLIGFLWCGSSDDCQLNIFDLQGNLVFNYSSDPFGKEGVHTIFDFDITEHELIILHDGKVAKFDLADFKKLGDDVKLTDWYRSIIRIKSGYIGHQSTLPYALNYMSLEGEDIAKRFEVTNYPLYISDLFQHTSDVYASWDKLFYFNYNPNLYRIAYEDGSYSGYLEVNLDKYALSEEELDDLIRAGAQFEEKHHRIMTNDRKFFFYNVVFDVKDLTYLMFKMDNKKYTFFFKKMNSEYFVFDDIMNDSGFDFLSYGPFLSDYTGVEMNGHSFLVLSLDPEYVLSHPVSNTLKIPSNWDAISSTVAVGSNPVLAFLRFK